MVGRNEYGFENFSKNTTKYQGQIKSVLIGAYNRAKVREYQSGKLNRAVCKVSISRKTLLIFHVLKSTVRVRVKVTVGVRVRVRVMVR